MTRVAMWSGPRNISTALMRAWENRSDTVVVDEPFYAAYLARTDGPRGDHPGRDDVIASQPDRPGEPSWPVSWRRCRTACRCSTSST